MPESIDGYIKARADAQKIVGKEGKLPRDDGSIKKDISAFNSVSADLLKTKDLAGTDLINWKKRIAAIKESAQAYKDDVEGSDFNLDAKNPDDKKKIDDAQKVLTEALDFYITTSDAVLKVTEDVYKLMFSTDKQWDQLTEGN